MTDTTPNQSSYDQFTTYVYTRDAATADDEGKIFLDRSGLDQACDAIAKQIQDDESFVPDSIIVIAKGGMLPGMALSRTLGIPIIASINLSSYDAIKKGPLLRYPMHIPDLTGRSVLIVDDLVDSGETLAHVMQGQIAEIAQAKEHKSACLFCKPEAAITPDYTIPMPSQRLVYPYESDAPTWGNRLKKEYIDSHAEAYNARREAGEEYDHADWKYCGYVQAQEFMSHYPQRVPHIIVDDRVDSVMSELAYHIADYLRAKSVYYINDADEQLEAFWRIAHECIIVTDDRSKWSGTRFGESWKMTHMLS